MAVRMRLDPIIPQEVARGQLQMVRRVEKAVKEETEIAERMFGKTYSNWKNEDKPRWQFKFRSIEDVEGIIFTRSTPYVFVSGGTSVRKRIMTPDYVPKTRPGVLGSRRGKGSVAGKGLARGIVARNFQGTIAERRQVPFTTKILKVIVFSPWRGSRIVPT